MFCASCGNKFEGQYAHCPKCGRPTSTRTKSEDPAVVSPHLCIAILTTIFCCLPLGIVAIIYGVNANAYIAAGDNANAKKSSSLALSWSIAALVVGLIVIAIWVIPYLITLLGLGAGLSF